MYYMKALIPTLLSLSIPLRVSCIQEVSVPIDFEGDQVAQLEVIDSSSPISRSLQQDNANCNVFSETSCTVTSENGVRCEDFFVTPETCRSIVINMKYVMCNNEQQRTVTLIDAKTIALSFQQSVDISKEPLSSGQCRTENYSTTIDSCETRKIVGSLKVEGHSDPSKIGYYCYAFSYYSTRIFRPSSPATSSPTRRITNSPTSSPTKKVPSGPTPDLFRMTVDQEVQCFIDNGRFDTTCANYLASVRDGDAACLVNIVYRYNIRNTGSVCERIDSIRTSINGGANNLLPLGSLQGKNFCPGETVSLVERQFNVQLCNLRGEEIPFEVSLNGGGVNRVGDGLAIFPESNVVTPSPTRRATNAPTTSATFGEINYEFKIECRMEATMNSLNFNVPCESVNFYSFTPETLRRNVMFRFIVLNKSAEPIKISNLIMKSPFTSFPAVIASSLDGITIGVGKQEVFEETYLVRFGNFNNQDIQVAAVVDAEGISSTKTLEREGEYLISVPNLFEISVDPEAQCFIDNGRFDTTCAEYLASVRNGDPGCVVNIVYKYNIKNTGIVCENINIVTSSVNGGPKKIVPLDDLQNRNFCPGETVSLLERQSNVQLCNLRGEELAFEVSVNGGGIGQVGECLVLFPEGNIVTPVPTPSGSFDFIIESTICFVKIDGRSMLCEEFINEFSGLIGTNDPACYNEVEYRYSLKNIGKGCGMINDIKTAVNGKVVSFDISGWTENRKKFCENETLLVRRPEANVNVCALAGTDIDLAISINNADAESFIFLPFPNNVPTSTPPQGPTSCVKDPEKMVFQFTGDLCSRSFNSQGRKRRRNAREVRRLSHSKGKGSNKKPAPAPVRPAVPSPGPGTGPSTPDIEETMFTCTDFGVTDASVKVTVTNLSGSLLLFDGTVNEGGNLSIGDPKHLIPDDIRINVYNGYGALVQSVQLHSSCSIPMRLGETFGAFKLVGFTNSDGTSSL